MCVARNGAVQGMVPTSRLWRTVGYTVWIHSANQQSAPLQALRVQGTHGREVPKYVPPEDETSGICCYRGKKDSKDMCLGILTVGSREATLDRLGFTGICEMMSTKSPLLSYQYPQRSMFTSILGYPFNTNRHTYIVKEQ